MRYAEMVFGNVRLPGELPTTVTQTTHGFIVGDAIRHNSTIFLKAQANNAENAQTCGIVTKIIDADIFQYQSEGFFLDAAFAAGKEYFLSPATAGLVMELPVPEVWTVGEVRQSLGWGTPQGLKIEIDVGDEIGEATVTANEVESLTIAGGNLTLTQSAGANVSTPFPYYTKTELNTSGAGGQVHWDNLVGVPYLDNYVSWKVYYNGIYGNIVRSEAYVDFVAGTGLDLVYNYANPNHTITFSLTDSYYTQAQLYTGGSGAFVAWANISGKPFVNTQYSIEGGGNLSTNKILNLIGDVAVPGNLKYYGTNTIGTRGFYDLPSGVTDHGALTGLADNDHPQYAFIHGDYGNYFQVADLRIGSATGWKLVDNGSVLELQYNGVKKFEFKTTGEAYGTDFIAY